MNFAVEVLERAPHGSSALIERTLDGGRRIWTFGEIGAAAARLAGHIERQGAGRGDVVVISVGNRAEWVIAMVACFRIGAVAASCPEQLRAADLRLRLKTCAPKVVIGDTRNRDVLTRAAPECPVIWIPDEDLWRSGEPAQVAPLGPEDPCLLSFTSGTSGAPKAVVHLQRYLLGQRTQAEHWMGARPGEIVWCTASSGWSKSARNAFIAPWLLGATALVHDGRFDPEERLSIIIEEQVGTLCMAPTEYRIIAKRARIPEIETLHSCIAAGEALDAATIEHWREATGTEVRDGYGQTEIGQVTGGLRGEPVRPGSMGRPLPGMRLWIEDGELVVDPQSVPTFFGGYLGEPPVARAEPWHTGDRVEVDEEGFLWFRGRSDDIIISAGYRIGPFEVESALMSHRAVEEAAAVSAADEERGAVVRAIVVLREGFSPSAELRRELQDHVKSHTAPYKYPRRLEFAVQLPKTPSGKIRRAELRERAG